MRTDNGLNKFDTWSYVHLFGSWCLAMVLWKIFSRTPLDAVIITFGCGVFWEICDEIYHYLSEWIEILNDNLFDKRGASWLDIIMDLIGCLGAIWVLN